MSESPLRVVFDTVIFVQNILSSRGHAAGCLDALRAGRFILLMSDATFAELREVPLRPKLVQKYPFITPAIVASFVAEIESRAAIIAKPPKAMTLPRDPDDEPFIDLAIAGEAHFIVTWNERHLTYLMKQDSPEGREFCHRFPNTKIVSPPDFLAILRSRS